MFLMWAPADISFEIEEGDDGRVAIVIVSTPEGDVELLAEFQETINGLRLVGTHIASTLDAHALSVSRIRLIAEVAMERMGYDAIEVEGAVRTSGANPGRRPRVLRFARGRGAAARENP